MQRIVDAFIGPQRAHRDDAVVGLAVAAQPLPPDVGRPAAILAVPGIVDDQDPTRMRRCRRIGEQQLQPPSINRVAVPCGLRQEVLQPLHRRVLGAHDRLSFR